MLSDMVGLALGTAPIIALLLWRDHVDARERAAMIVRAEVHAAARRALGGDSMLAIDVQAPTVWHHGQVRLSAPDGYEPVLGQAFHSVLARMPAHYDVVIHCGGGA